MYVIGCKLLNIKNIVTNLFYLKKCEMKEFYSIFTQIVYCFQRYGEIEDLYNILSSVY